MYKAPCLLKVTREIKLFIERTEIRNVKMTKPEKKLLEGLAMTITTVLSLHPKNEKKKR